MTLTDLQRETFLALVCQGIGHKVPESALAPDWSSIYALASQQGLSAVVMDGVDALLQAGRLPEVQAMDTSLRGKWIAEVVLGHEQVYEDYCKAIGSLAGFYNAHGLRMMVLKGYACSLAWPRPDHRPCGDIDIWQFGGYKKGDALIGSLQGIRVDTSHHHHTVFAWKGYSVENHYDFINVHHQKSNVELEGIFKELGRDDTYSVDVCGEKVYLPSPNLHALFLLKHAMAHFAADKMTLRQLLDFAFHVQKQGTGIDWKWLLGVLDRFGMMPAFSAFAAIIVEDLGFDKALFPDVSCEGNLKRRVLSEILSPEFQEHEPAGLFPRMLFKYRRWRVNGWKHKLCYRESMWSAFWSGLWNHLLKPSSI